MPLVNGGGRTRWIATGFFLLLALLIVTATRYVMPAAVIYPAAYYLYARQAPVRWPALVACAPLALALVPDFTLGAFLYSVLLVTALMMHLFLKRGSLGLAVAAPSAFIFVFVMAGLFSLAHENALSMQEVIGSWASSVVSESQKAAIGILSGTELKEFQDMIQAMRQRLVMLFPSLIVCGAGVMMWLNLLIISSRSRGMPLKEWRSPDWLIAVFILSGVLSLIPHEQIAAAGLNLLLVLGEVYLFQGFAITAVFMAERNWPALMRWPLYILILIQVYFMVIVAGLGLFDAWFDFRKRIRTPKGEIQ